MGNLQDLNFNAEEVQPLGTFEPLPAGMYPAVIMDSSVEKTKAGTGEYIKIQFEVVDGNHEGRYVWDRITIKNPNPKAVEIGLAQFSALCRAVNVLRPGDTLDLHNIPLLIKVAQRVREDNGEMTNEVKAYEATGNQYKTGAKQAKPESKDALDDDLPF